MLRLYQTPSFELLWQSDGGIFCLQTPGRSIEGMPGIEYTFHGKLRQLSGVELESGRMTQETLRDAHGQGQTIHIHYMETDGLAISLRIRLYQTRPFVLMKISVTNVGPETVAIRRFFIRSSPGGVRVTASPRGFFTNGWHSLSPASYLSKDEEPFSHVLAEQFGTAPSFTASKEFRLGRKGTHISEMVGAVVTPNEALIGGCVSTADQFVHFLADLSTGLNLFELQSQADDVPLEVGTSLSSEWLYLEWVPLPTDEPFAQYIAAVTRQMELGGIRDISLGWCSRKHKQLDLSEAEIFENLTGAALFGSTIPVKRFEISSGYQSETGDWGVQDETRFHHDCGWIAQRIKGSGFLPEISFSPLLVHLRSRIAREHPEWLLRNDKNTPLVVHLPKGDKMCLDVTHPSAHEYLTNIIHDIVHVWGYEGIHLSNMYIGALEARRYNQRLTRAQSLRRAFNCIHESAGPGISISAGESPFGPAVGLVDRMQTSCSTAQHWEPAKRDARTKKFLERELPSMRNTLLNILNRAWMNRRLWLNNTGPLTLNQKHSYLTKEELISQLTLIGMNGSEITVTDDMADVAPDTQSLLAKIFPPIEDGLVVVDLFESSLPELAVVKAARPWGRWLLAALFNWSDAYVERDLPSSLRLDAKSDYHLVDFWEERYFRIKSDSAWPVLHIDPHGVVLLSIRPVIKDSAHVVGSTFHISQGEEIVDCSVGDDSISLAIDLGRTAKGAVWLALPAKPTQILLDEKSLDLSAVRTMAYGIYAINFVLRDKAQLRIDWSMDFTE